MPTFLDDLAKKDTILAFLVAWALMTIVCPSVAASRSFVFAVAFVVVFLCLKRVLIDASS